MWLGQIGGYDVDLNRETGMMVEDDRMKYEIGGVSS